MNLTIKNIPEDVYKTLKEEAARKGRSLNSEVIEALSESAAKDARKEDMRRHWPELLRFVAKQKPAKDSVPLIRADRKRR